ncbi:unnamed protein product [Penicillium salamii]|uniref:Uncharacterized protein n=1 Tax=Penicillium salamii TaxID=1612424 RepID=A0A9W4I624_9EURO|nr:unnamed protein product [Penicillium salamii]CAG8214176.1 unnamed protein product [Penicillium salamii]CAG8228204.1 unnamed protein product [Penicillium salamii]CAG8313110.1 unnamed protein product [Penicillium salamii]CAG8356800.1 unnamed protein product [Penicillium salamii]
MIYIYVLTAIVAAINGIGMRHAVPLTGINPASSFLSRTFSSLEVAASIHGLHSLQPILSPLIFPSHSAGIENEFLTQHALHLKAYKDAKMALEKSSASLAHLSISQNGTEMNHWNQADEELWDRETPQSQFDINHWVPWVIAVLAMQAFALMLIFDIKCRHRMIERNLCGLWKGLHAISPEAPNSLQRYEGMVLKHLEEVTRLSRRIMQEIGIMSRESDRALTSIDGKLGQASLDGSIQQRTTKISNTAEQLASYYGNLSEDISYGVDLLGLPRMAPETVDSDDAPLSPGGTASKMDASSSALQLRFIPGNSSPGSSSGSTTPTPSNPKTPRHTPSPSPVPGSPSSVPDSPSPKPAPLPPVTVLLPHVPASLPSIPTVKPAVSEPASSPSKPASPPSKPASSPSKPASLPPVPALKPSVSSYALPPSKPTEPLPKRITLPPVPSVPALKPSKPAPKPSQPSPKPSQPASKPSGPKPASPPPKPVSPASKPAPQSSVPASKSSGPKPASPPPKPASPASKPAPQSSVPASKSSGPKSASPPPKPAYPASKPAPQSSVPATQSSVPAAKLPVSNGINGQTPLNWHNGPPPTD